MLDKYRKPIALGILIITLLYVAANDYRNNYRETTNWSSYSDNAIALQYPTQWHMNLCRGESTRIVLNGTIKGKYTIFDSVAGPETKELRIAGQANGFCNDMGIHFVSIDPSNDCHGRKALSNGVSVEHIVDEQEVPQIFVCNGKMTLFIFSFEDAINGANNTGMGTVSLDYLERSPQYKDIVKFAESIRIKTN